MKRDSLPATREKLIRERRPTLVTEKVGPLWLVTPQGQKTMVANTPPVYWQGQNGMHGVYLSPTYATDQRIYLTYVEPGDYGGGLALARARLNITPTNANAEAPDGSLWMLEDASAGALIHVTPK